ncbi:MAG TPA: outer membrane beta-barrel protein, partial [Candidatus Acidoferrum sp.]|nr:outer membrane beta-barrel protein [Candidatus Acidoferrum sp.]
FAGYVNWQVTPKWATSARSEIFHDIGGFRTGFDQKWGETTLTVAYFAQPQLGFRAETRWDSSNRPVFIQNLSGLTHYQSYDLQALVKF